MRTLQARAHVHLVDGMPHYVDYWIEPAPDQQVDVYLNCARYTREEAARLQAQLDHPNTGTPRS
jgi:hypothetical protein